MKNQYSEKKFSMKVPLNACIMLRYCIMLFHKSQKMDICHDTLTPFRALPVLWLQNLGQILVCCGHAVSSDIFLPQFVPSAFCRRISSSVQSSY